jgi:hypothetical protein
VDSADEQDSMALVQAAALGLAVVVVAAVRAVQVVQMVAGWAGQVVSDLQMLADLL